MVPGQVPEEAELSSRRDSGEGQLAGKMQLMDTVPFLRLEESYLRFLFVIVLCFI